MNPLNRFWPRRGRRPDPEPPRLDEAAKERLVMTALEGIAAGWTAAQLQAHLGPSRDDRAFKGWLANFAYRRWFPDPATHGKLAQWLVRWGELDGGALGKAAGAIGLALQHRASTPTLGAGTTAHETTEVASLQSTPTPEAGATAMSSAAAAPPEMETTTAPEDGAALVALGEQAFNLGSYEVALGFYDQALQRQPELAEAWLKRGNVLDALGRYGEAVQSYERYGSGIENNLSSSTANDSNAPFDKGNALLNLGRYEEAIAAYDAALAIKPDKHDALNNKGAAQLELGRYEEALSACNAALAINLDYPEALTNKGNALGDLGRYEEAIAAYDAALAVKPNSHEVLTNKGNALGDLGRYEEAIAAYDAALAIKPDSHKALTYQGNALGDLGRYEEAIAAYDAALAVKPNYHAALTNKGNALLKLGRYEDAITTYDAVLAIKPDNYVTLNNKGLALKELGRYEEAIASYDAALSFKPGFSSSWLNRGVAARNSWQRPEFMRLILPPALQNIALDQRGYDGQIACYQAGLRQVTATADPLGWGQLHWYMGRTYFHHHRFTEQAHRYARTALGEYAQALTTLTAYPEAHLQVLQDSIRAHLLLGQHPQARQQREEGLALLRDLINRHPQQRQQLEQQFSGFSHLEVDMLLQEGSPIAALEAAERYKNRALTWLLDALGETRISPSLDQIATLLRPNTALVMWHLSPDALTRFVLLPGHPDPIATRQSTGELETWLKTWDRDYGDYRSKGKTKDGPPRQRHPWRKELSPRLDRLADILDISSLRATLAESHITHLILIPHGDLHRLPLHTCFGDGYTSHTLPSAQLGLTLQGRPSYWPLPPQSPLLSIESPSHHGLAPLLFAEIESALLCQLFPPRQRLSDIQATADRVTTALTTGAPLIHFTGHGLYQDRAPQDSALFLAGDDTLTVQTLRQISLDSCHLISLAACETALTRQETLTADYVGLASAFLKAGASTVLSTLWTVESISSAWFIVYFYEQLRAGQAPAPALHQTQTWLRTVTPATLRPWLQAHLTPALQASDPGAYEALGQEIERLSTLTDTIGATQPPYGDPYYWAAFVLTGRGHESL